MFRITTNDLIAIHDSIGIEVNEVPKAMENLDPETRKSRNASPESTVDTILNPASLTNKFFSNRQNIPNEDHSVKLDQFQQTGILVGKLCLLTVAGSKMESDELYESYVNEMFACTTKVFEFKNLEAELYILFKLKSLLDTDYFKQESNHVFYLNQKIKLNALSKQAISSVWSNINIDGLENLIPQFSRYAVMGHDDETVREWINEFVIEAMSTYGLQTTISGRARVLRCAFHGCDPIKEMMNEDEINSLLQIAASVNEEIAVNDTYWNACKTQFWQYLSFVNEYRAIIFISESLALTFTAFSSYLSKQLADFNVERIKMVIAFSNATAQELATIPAAQLKILKGIAQKMIQNLNGATLAESLESAEIFRSISSWGGYAINAGITGVMIAGTYSIFKHSSFFKPVHMEKVDMPQWLLDKKEQQGGDLAYHRKNK